MNRNLLFGIRDMEKPLNIGSRMFAARVVL